jgi:hypothetical protein
MSGAVARRTRDASTRRRAYLTCLDRLRVLDPTIRNLERRIAMQSTRSYFRRTPYRRRRHYRGPRRRPRRISDLQIIAMMLLIIIIAWLISSH